MEIYIGKIWNPATAVKSVEIGVRIDHVANGSNRVIELYHDTFELFLDPQSKVSPGLLANSMDLNTNQFFTTGQDVTDINGYLYLTSQSFGIPVSGSYYFVIKLPPYLQVQNNQVAPTSFFDCSPMSYVWCISLAEIKSQREHLQAIPHTQPHVNKPGEFLLLQRCVGRSALCGDRHI